MKNMNRFFDKFSTRITHFTGSSWAFGLAFLFIVIWIVTGPAFHFSDTWQLVINTSTTIITFLMVFIIQRSQNKDSIANQIKLNELIKATDGASDYLIDIEDLTQEELDVLHKYYELTANQAKKKTDMIKKRRQKITELSAQSKVEKV